MIALAFTHTLPLAEADGLLVRARQCPRSPGFQVVPSSRVPELERWRCRNAASEASAFQVWQPATSAPFAGAVTETAGLLRSITMLPFVSEADAPAPLCAVAFTQTFVPSAIPVTSQFSEYGAAMSVPMAVQAAPSFEYSNTTFVMPDSASLARPRQSRRCWP